MVQKAVTKICYCDNFHKCTPILIIFSLLEQEIYEFMTHKSNIMPATSPLLCNHNT